MLHSSPHLKKTCVRQVVLDKWFPLKSSERRPKAQGRAHARASDHPGRGFGGLAWRHATAARKAFHGRARRRCGFATALQTAIAAPPASANADCTSDLAFDQVRSAPHMSCEGARRRSRASLRSPVSVGSRTRADRRPRRRAALVTVIINIIITITTIMITRCY